jgi:hypothetical protein
VLFPNSVIEWAQLAKAASQVGGILNEHLIADATGRVAPAPQKPKTATTTNKSPPLHEFP